MYCYKDITQNEIAELKSLWEGNRIFHQHLSKYFSADYEGLIFEQRMNALFEYAEKVKITVAKDETAVPVGYCLSIIHGNTGEVATLYIDEQHRKKGIAKKLLSQHLDWLKGQLCKDIFVHVLSVNEHAIRLYEDMGFEQDLLKMRVPVESLEK